MSRTPQKAYISNTQYALLLVCLMWPTILGYGGGMIARQVGRDMVLSGFIGLITTMLLALMVVWSGRQFPDKTVVEYSQLLLGGFLGKALGLVLIGYFLLAATQSIAVYVHHIADFLLPDTPFIAIIMIHVLVICYLIWYGPEVIARVSVLGFLTAFLLMLLLLLATIQEINLDRILPMPDNKLVDIGAASLTVNSFIGQSLPVIALILPLIKNQRVAGRSTIVGLTIGGVFFLSFFFSELMVMGPWVTAQMRIACMDLVRAIQLTRYLHRFESFMVALWYWSMLVQAGVLTYCASLALRQTVGLGEKNRWLVIAIGVVLIALTWMIAANRVTHLYFLEHGWQYISLPVQFGLPIILLIASFIHKLLSKGAVK